MEKNYVITIGRQFGSGGREIGHQLAGLLEIDYYDKELLQEIEKKSGLSSEYLSKTDETPQGHWTHALAGFLYDGIYTQERVFRFQSETIRQIAAKGPCIIVGRCADYILRDHPNCINTFVHAPLEFCVERLYLNDGVPREEGMELAVKMNKKRATYYNYYTDKKWGHITSYHLSVDSSVVGIDQTVALMAEFVRRKMKL
ncbi:MAG: cytidylate kinase-like family protein [Rikenellaceae bacterium]|nr:cytidylate kinase-like family protein [Rikenellaceae bacterium]